MKAHEEFSVSTIYEKLRELMDQSDSLDWCRDRTRNIERYTTHIWIRIVSIIAGHAQRVIFRAQDVAWAHNERIYRHWIRLADWLTD